MPIKNYTTEVPEEKTVGEIIGLLASKGAAMVRVDYDTQGRPTGVSFGISVNGLPLPFKMPCNFRGVFQALGYRGEMQGEREARTRRIAWRILKDWVAAQMAIIEAQQASIIQVFLPYAVPNESSGATVFEQFMEQMDRQKKLPESVQ